MRWMRMVSVFFCSSGWRSAEETRSSRTRARASSSDLQSADGLVVSRTGHAMDADGQRVFLLIGLEIGGGNQEFPNQGPRLLFLGQVRAHQPDQRRFGAVGDHLDGVGEHFSQGGQLSRALVWRQ